MNYLGLCSKHVLRVSETLQLYKIVQRGQGLKNYLVQTKMADHHETVFDVFSRATTYLAHDNCDNRTRFLEEVANFRIILGSPILTNAGRRHGKSISACAIPPVRLSKMLYNEIEKIVGHFHSQGMGTGFSFDELDDPTSMILYLNEVAVNEVSRGIIERPSGNMGVLSIDHPQVLDFIRVKKTHAKVQDWKFNISINITDAFVHALKEKAPFVLKNGQVVDPEALLWEISENAHATGDPGIVFLDRMNASNRVPQLGSHKAVVPCGEVSLFDGEVCQFAYLNLPRFIVDGTIDVALLKNSVHTIVLLLDNAIDANTHTLPEESAHIIAKLRRIGIGVCGLAEMLQALGHPYDSEEGRTVALNVISLINYESKKASIQLAQEKGPFPAYFQPETKREHFLTPFLDYPTEYVSKDDWKALFADFNAYGIRNLSTTIIPPAGRSSLVAGVTGSIEPPFRLVADTAFREALESSLAKYPYAGNVTTIFNIVNATGSIQGTDLPDDVKRIFKCALEISPEAHLKMAELFQRHVDEGVSKTINLPYSITTQDIAALFKTCIDSNLKGITIYRDRSRIFQPKELSKHD